LKGALELRDAPAELLRALDPKNLSTKRNADGS
jgi:hypothetical protein